MNYVMHLVLKTLLLIVPLALLVAGCSGSDAGLTATTPATPTPSSPAPTVGENSRWVQERLDAVATLYDISADGRQVLAGLDVRQMRGQPGYFGSRGFRSWTGVGEAKPAQVIHELGHAYWGAFPITGFPELTWDVPRGEVVAPAMQRYHDDAVRFLSQPPDPYELLRQRLKNLPRLSSDNLSPLFHIVEADMVPMTAGDLSLVPPILRKYWDRFLEVGPFLEWDEAAGWYSGLPPQEKAAADRYLRFQSYDLRQLQSFTPEDPTHLPEAARETVKGEQLQRLWDFADQFDLLVQRPEERQNFRFWRGYLREIRNAHHQHPTFLADTGLPLADEITRALTALEEIEDLPAGEKASRLAQELEKDPFVGHFLPTLDNATLQQLFLSGVELPEEATLKGTAAFVERLRELTPVVERILAAGAESPADGAAELRRFLPRLDLETPDETDLFFAIFAAAGVRAAREITVALDQATKRELLIASPVQLRFLLGPSEVARALDITAQATPEQMAEGISLMIQHPAGNFRTEELFLAEMYRVVASRGEREPRQMLQVLANSPFPVGPFIYLQPAAAVAILSSDLDVTTELVRGSDPVQAPPARVVYSLIFADPAFAARVVERLDSRGDHALVLESLAHFAYDKARAEANPDLPISLRKDGLFLQALLEDEGSVWLEQQLRAAVALYTARVQADEVPADFLEAYEATLEAAAETLSEGVRPALLAAIRNAFGPGG